MSTFTGTKATAIIKGGKRRARLESIVHAAVQKQKPTYIYSPAGLGKSFTVAKEIAASGTKNFMVNGAVSMFALGVTLAGVAYKERMNNDTIIVNVDDCDELLKNVENVNVMKNMLADGKVYAYTRKMIGELTDAQQDAIDFYSDDSKLGFVVPLEKFVFIITSNYMLPTDDDVNANTGTAKGTLMAHRNAIRSRCRTNDFNMQWQEQWGWIADVVLNTDSLGALKSKTKKVVLLDWMYENWADLTERSIRTAEKMMEIMLDNPKDYLSDWEIDFLK